MPQRTFPSISLPLTPAPLPIPSNFFFLSFFLFFFLSSFFLLRFYLFDRKRAQAVGKGGRESAGSPMLTIFYFILFLCHRKSTHNPGWVVPIRRLGDRESARSAGVGSSKCPPFDGQHELILLKVSKVTHCIVETKSQDLLNFTARRVYFSFPLHQRGV